MSDSMKPVIVQCPVKGVWAFMNPPGHHPHAKDLVAVDQKGRPYSLKKIFNHLFFRLSVTDTYAWDQPIYAPCNAHVIHSESDCADRLTLNLLRDLFIGLVINPRKRNAPLTTFVGNHIVLRSEHGEFALLAHMRQESLTVQTGDHVCQGQLLGRIGNSGTTIQPHLHFQLMKENDLMRSIPLQFCFNRYEQYTPVKWIMRENDLPKNYQVFRIQEKYQSEE